MHIVHSLFLLLWLSVWNEYLSFLLELLFVARSSRTRDRELNISWLSWISGMLGRNSNSIVSGSISSLVSK